jgi:nucleotide-binding universal stress UspA family protein
MWTLYGAFMRAKRVIRLERLLVASDGQPAGDAALLFARLLADRDRADVEVVGVFCPRIPVPPVVAGSCEHDCEPHDRRAVAELLERVWQQTRERIKVPWPIHVRVGHPPWMISDMARSGRASLVLLGHTTLSEEGGHRTSRHTAEQVSYGCDVPVLTVPPDVRRLPRSALVVVDDGEASRRAVAMTGAVLERGGTVHKTKGSASIETLHIAEGLGADLVCVPLTGESFAVRSLMGGGVADVLDHARCMVLITPSVAKSSLSPSPRAVEPTEVPCARP